MNSYYVYGIFYEDDTKENVCFYIGSGKGDRLKKHFYESQKGQNPHKERKTDKLIRQGYEVKSVKLADNLSREAARKLEQRLLNKDKIWDNLTNIRRDVDGSRPECYSKLTKKEAKEVKWLADHSKLTQKRIAEKYGLTKQGVSKIKHADSWRDVGKTRPAFYEDEKLDKSGNRNKKYTDEEVGEIKWLLNNSDLKYSEIADRYGTYKGHVGKINNEHIREKVEPQKP